MRKFSSLFLFVVLIAGVSCTSALKSTNNTSPQTASTIGSYYDFPDILIPTEMEIDQDNSIMMQTPQYKTGILTYDGNVEAASLMHFFERNMIKDNWKLRSKFGYKRTILVFEKSDRDCVINILDGTYSTVLEIMVAPRLAPAPVMNMQPVYQAPAPVFEDSSMDMQGGEENQAQ